jgi:hypothetical protein
MARRTFLSQLAASLLALGATPQETKTDTLKVMMKSAWESDDPARASFPFLHCLALSDAGHDVQIFLTGEATYLMRKAAAERNAREDLGEENSGFCVRRLLARPRRYGGGLGDLECSAIRRSSYRSSNGRTESWSNSRRAQAAIFRRRGRETCRAEPFGVRRDHSWALKER